MLTRLQEDVDSQVEGKQLFEIFELETKTAGLVVSNKTRVFFEFLTRVYPNAIKLRKKSAHETKTFYQGIKIKPPHLDQLTAFESLSDVKNHVQHDFILEHEDETSVSFKHFTGYSLDDIPVNKVIHFNKNGKWTLKICGKEVNLSSVYVSDTFQYTTESVRLVCETVKVLRMCNGVKISTSVIVTRFHQYQRMKNENGINRRIVSSVLCDRIININTVSDTCKKCQKMTLNHPNKENVQPVANKENVQPVAPESSQTQSDNKTVKASQSKKRQISKDDIKTLIPDITDEMAELLQSQADNISRDPRGRRWSQKVISACLQWYCRSPQAYEAFRATKMLILPCPSTLIQYKNKVKQEPGFDDKILQWMHAEAVSKGIHKDGWMGGIVIDEMAIQADLQINKNGEAVELSGFTDLGAEGNDCTTIRTGKSEKRIGTYAMQFVFLGLSGFRFPFAHFITNGVQATELYPLFWQAVEKLEMFGFQVLYTSLDGAQSNRNFVKYNLHGEFCKPFKTKNTYYLKEVAFIMDVSHVIKKIRNSILSSGTAKGHTRLLTLPSNDTIQWQMFIDFFRWDKGNSFQLHRKLTNEHIILSCHSKMRNHLAEDMLNSEMLHCMCQYQLYLGEKGSVLNGTIELLKQTSRLVDIFKDMRPIVHSGDSRLTELQEISDWFDNWKCKSEGNPKQCMSYQCHEDIQSCTLGFIELCKMVLVASSQVFVTPGLVNSDIVENIFNQQRSTYNGANTNPNALQYRRSLNSIIIGQNIVSAKANAGKGRDAATALDISIKNYPAKRQKIQACRGMIILCKQLGTIPDTE